MSHLDKTDKDIDDLPCEGPLDNNLAHMCDIGLGKSFYTEYMRKNIGNITDEELVNLFVNVPLRHKIPFFTEIKKRGIKTIVLDLEGRSSRDDFLKQFDDQAGFVFVNGMADVNIFEAIDEIIKSYPSVEMIDIGQSCEEMVQDLNNRGFSKQEKKLPFHQTINTAFTKRQYARK